MKIVLVLASLLLLGIAAAQCDQNRTVFNLQHANISLAEKLANENNISAFVPWYMPFYGHYSSEEPEINTTAEALAWANGAPVVPKSITVEIPGHASGVRAGFPGATRSISGA